MRALLVLAVLLPIGALVAWALARGAVAATRRRRHIADLEAENERLDELIRPGRPFPTSGARGRRVRR